MSDHIDDGDVTDDVHRRRGRPALSPELRRTSKLTVSFTPDEMARIMHRAADERDDEGNPMDAREWARAVLIRVLGMP